MKFAIFFALFVASVVSEDGKKWAKKGKTAILDCTYEKDVKFCQWKRPDAGLLTFAGQPGVEQIDSNPRFKSIKTESPYKCTLYIETTEDEDQGAWTCLGRDNPENAFKEHRKIDLEFLDKPLQVSLDNPFDADNSTAMKSKQKLKCKAEHSISKPEFSWFVEDTKLEISEENIKTENGDNVWIQTLTYEPEEDHSNKSLKCLVNFESKFDEEESKEASILLSFTIEDIETMVNVEDEEEKENPEEIIKEAVQSDFFAMAAGVVGGVFFICLAVYMLYHYKCCCFKTQPTTTEVDAELGEENMTEKPAKESGDDDETEKADSTKEDKDSTQELTENVKKSLGERFSSFFRMNKSAVLEDDKPEQTDLAKAEDGMTEVAIDSNKEEKTDEDKKENVDEDEPTEIVVQGKFRNFFVKLFKTRDTVADKVSEEPVKMADCEIKEEYEPEDKPEPNPQVQEVAEPENKVTLTEPKEEKSPTLANETSF